MPPEEAGSNQTVDDLGVWLEITGGQRKGRTLGAGRAGDPRYVLTGESSSSCAQGVSSSTQESDLRNQLEVYQAQLTEEQALRMALQESVDSMKRNYEEREARVERENLEFRRRMEEDMQKMMEEMMRSRFGPRPDDPPQ